MASERVSRLGTKELMVSWTDSFGWTRMVSRFGVIGVLAESEKMLAFMEGRNWMMISVLDSLRAVGQNRVNGCGWWADGKGIRDSQEGSSLA